MEQQFSDIDKGSGWNNYFQEIRNSSNQYKYLSVHARKPENKILNRYRDVYPFDHTRVILQRGDKDYINANKLKVQLAKRSYILTQGPLPITTGHFWLMVWEQKSKAILMLNRVIEKNVVKCHQYWPVGTENGGSDDLVLTDVNLKISFLSQTDKSYYIIRKFLLTDLESLDTREILQFHYTTWPDFGVPESPAAFLDFLFAVRESGVLNSKFTPPVVHCSAGIGRSGTFCLVESCLVLIEEHNDLNWVNVRQILLEMRHYRIGLIQTPDQLRFSYQAIIEGSKRVLVEKPNKRKLPFNLEPSDYFAYAKKKASMNENDAADIAPPPLPPRLSQSSEDLFTFLQTNSQIGICNSKPLPVTHRNLYTGLKSQEERRRIAREEEEEVKNYDCMPTRITFVEEKSSFQSAVTKKFSTATPVPTDVKSKSCISPENGWYRFWDTGISFDKPELFKAAYAQKLLEFEAGAVSYKRYKAEIGTSSCVNKIHIIDGLDPYNILKRQATVTTDIETCSSKISSVVQGDLVDKSKECQHLKKSDSKEDLDPTLLVADTSPAKTLSESSTVATDIGICDSKISSVVQGDLDDEREGCQHLKKSDSKENPDTVFLATDTNPMNSLPESTTVATDIGICDAKILSVIQGDLDDEREECQHLKKSDSKENLGTVLLAADTNPVNSLPESTTVAMDIGICDANILSVIQDDKSDSKENLATVLHAADTNPVNSFPESTPVAMDIGICDAYIPSGIQGDKSDSKENLDTLLLAADTNPVNSLPESTTVAMDIGICDANIPSVIQGDKSDSKENLGTVLLAADTNPVNSLPESTTVAMDIGICDANIPSVIQGDKSDSKENLGTVLLAADTNPVNSLPESTTVATDIGICDANIPRVIQGDKSDSKGNLDTVLVSADTNPVNSVPESTTVAMDIGICDANIPSVIQGDKSDSKENLGTVLLAADTNPVNSLPESTTVAMDIGICDATIPSVIQDDMSDSKENPGTVLLAADTNPVNSLPESTTVATDIGICDANIPIVSQRDLDDERKECQHLKKSDSKENPGTVLLAADTNPVNSLPESTTVATDIGICDAKILSVIQGNLDDEGKECQHLKKSDSKENLGTVLLTADTNSVNSLPESTTVATDIGICDANIPSVIQGDKSDSKENLGTVLLAADTNPVNSLPESTTVAMDIGICDANIPSVIQGNLDDEGKECQHLKKSDSKENLGTVLLTADTNPVTSLPDRTAVATVVGISDCKLSSDMRGDSDVGMKSEECQHLKESDCKEDIGLMLLAGNTSPVKSLPESSSELRKRARKEREEKTAIMVQNIKKKQKESELWEKRRLKRQKTE